MSRIAIELLLTLIATAFGGGVFQTLLKSVLEKETVSKAVQDLSWRDAAGVLMGGLGFSSLLMSYFGWLWVQGPGLDWWRSFHLEAGVALVFVGIIDNLLLRRISIN